MINQNLTNRLFTQEQITKIIGESIPLDAPETHIIVGTVDLEGAQIVASFKRQMNPTISHGIGWELQAVARHDWTGDNQVGGKVILRW